MPTIDRPKAQREDVLAYWRKNPEKNAVEVCAHFAKKRQALTPEQCRAWKSRHGIGPRDDAPSVAPGGKGDALVPEVLPRGSASGGVTGSRDVQGCGGVSPPERGPGVRGEVTVAPRARGEVVEADPIHVGRPVSFDPVVGERIAVHIRNGAPWEFACSAEGIMRQTASYWLEQAKAGNADYAAFLSVIERAEGQAVTEMSAEIRKAASGGKGEASDLWTSRAWLLERRWPQHFGRTAQPGEQGPTVAVQVNFAEGVSVEAISSAVSADAERRRKG